MCKRSLQLTALLYCAIAFSLLSYNHAPLMANNDGKNSQLLEKTQQLMANQSIAFIKNEGQITDNTGKLQPNIRYMVTVGGMAVYFMKDRVSYVFTEPQWGHHEQPEKSHEGITETTDLLASEKVCRIDMEFMNSNSNVELYGKGNVLSNKLYYQASNTSSIQPLQYNTLVYKNIYHNIDLVFSIAEGGLKYDYVVHPGGDPNVIRWQYAGAERTSIAKSGKLRIATSMGMLEEHIPLTYQTASLDNGAPKKQVRSAFSSHNGVMGFRIASYNPQELLVIDPQITWATYYGSRMATSPTLNYDFLTSVAVDNADNVIAVGYTQSNRFPAVAGVQMVWGGGTADAIIVKFDPAGALLWATYYGGSGDDRAMGVVTDATNNILVTGYTNSPNFPTVGGLHVAPLGGMDAFIVHLPPAGAPLNWASYYGGSGNDYGMDIAVTAGGIGAITGYTNSPAATFDLALPVQPVPNGGFDAFVIQGFGPFLGFGTYLGGDANDYGMGIVIDALGDITLTGYTQGPGFLGINYPTTPAAAQPAYNGGAYDAFMTRISSPALGAPALVWSTYVGGNSDDRGMDLTLANGGTIVAMVGYSNSMGLPIPGPFHMLSTNNWALIPAPYDALIVGFDYPSGIPALGALMYGSVGNDYGNDIAEAAGTGFLPRVVITGTTDGNDLLMRQAFEPNYAGGVASPPIPQGDAFIAKFVLPLIGDALVWSTYYGCAGNDNGNGIAVNSQNKTVCVGSSIATTATGDQVIVRNAVYATPPGGVDGFVAVFADESRFPTFHGGKQNEHAEDIVVDMEGNTIITGWVESTQGTFSVSTSASQTLMGGGATDAFVAKFNTNGERVWTTYYGGNGDDVAKGIAVDNSNNIVIAGYTSTMTGSSIATVGAYGGGANDAFVAKFDKNGVRLWGRYLGGTGDDQAMDVAIDDYDDIVVTGFANSSTGISTTTSSVFNPMCGNPYDAFCVKYSGTSATGTVLWGRYSGGTDDDRAMGVAIDSPDRIIMTGYTTYNGPYSMGCSGYPTYGSATSFGNTTATVQKEIFVTKYYADGSSPWSLVYGGEFDDEGAAVAVGAWTTRSIFVTGYTDNKTGSGGGGTFPIAASSTGTIFATPSGTKDIYVLRFDTLGVRHRAIVQVSGVPGDDYADAIAVKDGKTAVAGWTPSTSFPGVTGIGGVQSSFVGGANDGFVMVVDENLSSLYGTYVGTNADDRATGIAFSNWGADPTDILLCGWSDGADFTAFPNVDTYWSFQPINAGQEDAFIAKLTLDVMKFTKGGVALGETPARTPFTQKRRVGTYQVYPNPTEGLFTIQGETSEDVPVQCTLTTVLGATVLSFEEHAGKGAYNRTVNIEHLPAGTYLLTIQAGDTRSSVKLVKR